MQAGLLGKNNVGFVFGSWFLNLYIWLNKPSLHKHAKRCLQASSEVCA
jgi:hypothetical protein